MGGLSSSTSLLRYNRYTRNRAQFKHTARSAPTSTFPRKPAVMEAMRLSIASTEASDSLSQQEPGLDSSENVLEGVGNCPSLRNELDVYTPLEKATFLSIFMEVFF